MVKEEKKIFHKAVIIVIIILMLNVAFLFYNYYSSNRGVTGLSIGERVSTTFIEMNLSTKIFLGIQWFFLIFFLVITFVKDRNTLSRKQELEGLNIEKIIKGQGTSLDNLYKVLKEKKQLRISTIAKIFDIDYEKAMQWCRTLEDGNLASIEYPGMGEKIVKINEK
jgi:hypothetical protein